MTMFTMYPALLGTAIRLHMEANMLIKHKKINALERRPHPKCGSVRGGLSEASQRRLDDTEDSSACRESGTR